MTTKELIKNVFVFLCICTGMFVPHTQIRAQYRKLDAETENPPEFVAGELLVKFKEDPQLRLSGWFERTALGTPVVAFNSRSLNQLSKDLSLESAVRIPLSREPLYKLSLGKGVSVDEAVTEFEADAQVEFAEPNYILHTCLIPDDPYFQYQWNFEKVNSPQAWDMVSGGGSNVVVAIIDSGVAYEDFVDPNPGWCLDQWGFYYECIEAGETYAQLSDFSQTNFVAGYDFINDDYHPNDDYGHGTHIAATIAESTNNAIKSAGLAFNISIMPIKVTTANMHATLSAVVAGLNYARDNGAQVVNLALGINVDLESLREAIENTLNAGITIIAPSGNNSSRQGCAQVSYPAAYPGVIAIGATRVDDLRSNYSNCGPNLDLVAPGGQLRDDDDWYWLDLDNDLVPDGILQETIFPGELGSADFDPSRFTALGYNDNFWDTYCIYCLVLPYWTTKFWECGLAAGTSMATAHVTAAAALILSKNETLQPGEIKTILENSTQDLGPAGWDEETGHGLLDIQAALNITPPGPPPALAITISPEGIPDTALAVENVKIEVGNQTLIETFERSGDFFSKTVATLSYLPSGTYTVYVKGSLHLQQAALVDLAGGETRTVDLSADAMLTGDLDSTGDSENKVDAADIKALFSGYTTASSTEDINFDGIVNMYDAGFIIKNWGEVGE